MAQEEFAEALGIWTSLPLTKLQSIPRGFFGILADHDAVDIRENPPSKNLSVGHPKVRTAQKRGHPPNFTLLENVSVPLPVRNRRRAH
jgi:hypothetical protein